MVARALPAWAILGYPGLFLNERKATCSIAAKYVVSAPDEEEPEPEPKMVPKTKGEQLSLSLSLSNSKKCSRLSLALFQLITAQTVNILALLTLPMALPLP